MQSISVPVLVISFVASIMERRRFLWVRLVIETHINDVALELEGSLGTRCHPCTVCTNVIAHGSAVDIERPKELTNGRHCLQNYPSYPPPLIQQASEPTELKQSTWMGSGTGSEERKIVTLKLVRVTIRLVLPPPTV